MKILIRFVCWGSRRILMLIDYLFNLITFYTHKIKIGKYVTIRGKIKIYGSGQIFIGNRVKINSHIRYNPIGGQSGVIFNTFSDGRIGIGENTGLSNVCICAYKSVAIGSNVFIGGNVKIYDTDFHSIMLVERLCTPDRGIRVKSVIINDGVFIGGSSIILKGVTIGENSVIGAGSVVTKSVPANQIWAGNPAHFIRNII